MALYIITQITQKFGTKDIFYGCANERISIQFPSMVVSRFVTRWRRSGAKLLCNKHPLHMHVYKNLN